MAVLLPSAFLIFWERQRASNARLTLHGLGFIPTDCSCLGQWCVHIRAWMPKFWGAFRISKGTCASYLSSLHHVPWTTFYISQLQVSLGASKTCASGLLSWSATFSISSGDAMALECVQTHLFQHLFKSLSFLSLSGFSLQMAQDHFLEGIICSPLLVVRQAWREVADRRPVSAVMDGHDAWYDNHW